MEKLLTVKELIGLGIKKDKAYQLMHNKSFPAIKLGGRYYVEKDALKEWLKKNRYKEVLL